jgi:cytidylate kinase
VAQIVTIDGPAGAGKSTVSRQLAAELGFLYLDTGAMYRAVALQAERMEVDLDRAGEVRALCRALELRFEAAGGENRLFLGHEDITKAIRSPRMDLLSSRISAIKEVREAMTELQRRIGENASGLVAEGRDMGTVVFEDAESKFYVTASQAVRAERRYNERRARGELPSRTDVEREIKQRDEQDTTRAIAPLRPAEDAVRIDSSELTPAEVVDIMLDHIRHRRPQEMG